MDWLDETLNNYERSKAKEVELKAEEQKRGDAESRKNAQAAAEALDRAHKKFQEVKTKLVQRNYPCEVNLGSLTDARTDQKFPHALILLVRNVPLREAETLSRFDPSLVLTANLGSDDISVITTGILRQEVPAITKIKIDMLTDDSIDTIIKKFINQIFK